MVALLITHRLDKIGSQHPRVAEPVDEGFSSEEISSLLLKSENLQWMRLQESPPQSKRTWSDLSVLPHQKGCTHQLVHAVFESPGPSSSGQTLEEQDKESLESGVSLEHASIDETRMIVPDAFLEAPEFFTRLELREQKLLQSCGIGGLFSPWSKAFNPGFTILSGGQAKIMYGEPDLVRAIEEQRGRMLFPDGYA